VITVVNKVIEPDHIYCGRGSPLGNPYPMHGSSDAERDYVCDRYQKYFDTKIKDISPENREFHHAIWEIISKAKKGDVNLGCFCAPRRCHCETIKSYVEGVIASETTSEGVPGT